MGTIKLRFGKKIQTASHVHRAGPVVEFRRERSQYVDQLIELGAEVVFDEAPKTEPEPVVEIVVPGTSETEPETKPKRRYKKRKTKKSGE